MIQLVYVLLGVDHHVQVAEPGRRSLVREHNVQHIGIFPVIIPPPVLTFRVILGGVQDVSRYELAVMQYGLAYLNPVDFPVHLALIVPIPDIHLLRGVQFGHVSILGLID